MPVELTSFTGELVNNSVHLDWETATEVNNYGFEVEKQYQVSSIEHQDTSWQPIGFVQGNGTTNSPKKYTFTDSNLPNTNEVSYRLKQIDNDGTVTLSKEVTVNISNVTNVDDEINYEFSLKQNYPNPFNPSTNIKFSIPQRGFVSLKVYDILGKEVARLVNKELNPGSYIVQFDAGDANYNLASGLYFYRLSSGNFSSSHKMLLLK